MSPIELWHDIHKSLKCRHNYTLWQTHRKHLHHQKWYYRSPVNSRIIIHYRLRSHVCIITYGFNTGSNVALAISGIHVGITISSVTEWRQRPIIFWKDTYRVSEVQTVHSLYSVWSPGTRSCLYQAQLRPKSRRNNNTHGNCIIKNPFFRVYLETIHSLFSTDMKTLCQTVYQNNPFVF